MCSLSATIYLIEMQVSRSDDFDYIEEQIPDYDIILEVFRLSTNYIVSNNDWLK